MNEKTEQNQNEAKPEPQSGVADETLLGDERVVNLIKYFASRVIKEKTWRLEDLSEVGGDEITDSIDREKLTICTNIMEILSIEPNSYTMRRMYDSFFT